MANIRISTFAGLHSKLIPLILTKNLVILKSLLKKIKSSSHKRESTNRTIWCNHCLLLFVVTVIVLKSLEKNIFKDNSSLEYGSLFKLISLLNVQSLL